MSKTVADVVDLDLGSAKEVYDLLVHSKKISKITGFDTSASDQEGAEISALNGGVIGRNLHVVPEKLIVQSWRRSTWRKDWLDAVVVIAFSDKENDNGVRVDLINANLPETEVQFMDWNTYWYPIRAYLMDKKKT